MGLDPRTPGLHPGPKAGAKPLSHPGIPGIFFYSGAPSGTLHLAVGRFYFLTFSVKDGHDIEALTYLPGRSSSDNLERRLSQR